MFEYPVHITANNKTIGIDNRKAFGETFAVPLQAMIDIAESAKEWSFGRHYDKESGVSVSWRVLD